MSSMQITIFNQTEISVNNTFEIQSLINNSW